MVGVSVGAGTLGDIAIVGISTVAVGAGVIPTPAVGARVMVTAGLTAGWQPLPSMTMSPTISAVDKLLLGILPVRVFILPLTPFIHIIRKHGYP
jgi:hypothetical protein